MNVAIKYLPFLVLATSCLDSGSKEIIESVRPMHTSYFDGKSSAITQIIKSEGKYVAGALTVNQNDSRALAMELNLDLSVGKEVWLKSADEVHLVNLAEGGLAYAVEKGPMTKEGVLASDVQVRRVPLNGRQDDLLFERSYTFTDGYSHQRGAVPYDEVLDRRRTLRPFYKPNGLGRPPFYLSGLNQVFIDRVFETLLGDLSSGHSSSVRPFLRGSDNGMSYVYRLQPVPGASGEFASIAEEEDLVDLLAGHKGGDFVPGVSYLVLANISPSGWSGHRIFPLASQDVFLRSLQYSHGRYLFGGSARGVSGRTHAWIACMEGTRIIEREFDLDGLSDVLAVDAKPEGVGVAGTYGYSQAATGSVSHSNGFVAILDLSLKNRWANPLNGKRSTVPTAVLLDGDRVIVGGFTNGPDTHSEDRSTQAFLMGFDSKQTSYPGSFVMEEEK